MYDGSGIHSFDQIRDAWQSTSHQVRQTFSVVRPDEFTQDRGDRWTYAQNLDHLTKSTQAVAGGLKMPKFILRLVIGRGPGTSRSFSELQSEYHQKLADGAEARGRFVPQNTASQEDALAGWDRCCRQFERGLGRWSESLVDGYVLPHPLLGPLTVREMLFFTIFHTHHHLEQMQRP